MIDNTTEVVNAVASVVTALFTLITGLATCGLVYIAHTQIRALRDENKKWETVKICNSYDSDPVLFECTNRIRKLSNGHNYAYSNLNGVIKEIMTLLNFFDSLAVGVAQGVYIESIIKDNLQLTIEHAVDSFTTDEYKKEISHAGLQHLIAMRQRWRPAPSSLYRTNG